MGERRGAVREGELLWQPSPQEIEGANLTDFARWLAARGVADADGYRALWRWSVAQPGAFWESVWEYAGIVGSRGAGRALSGREMPGARWFEGAEINYAENILRRHAGPRTMIVACREGDEPVEISGAEVRAAAAQLAAALRGLGVGPGDRVAGYLPNIPEAIVALLACASVGAVWSCCSPDFGARSVLDRFSQIDPAVLIATDGSRYAGRGHDRSPVVEELRAALPTLRATVLVPSPHGSGLAGALRWGDLVGPAAPAAEERFQRVPFEHPLWILYSSGTTGLPKPIVHGHGGILLEHAKATILHNDLRPDDRFFWYSSTGWMMWNYMVGALLSGCSIVTYDGSPGWPSLGALWDLAERVGITYVGTSAAFIGACMKAGLSPAAGRDLSRVRALGSTGSPLSSAGFGWVYEHVGSHLALESISGGTDVCTAFVGGVRTLPVYAGEIQAALLGADVRALDPAGRELVGEVGELVLATPMPSMPIAFWNDPGGERYRASYFEVYPGLWRHGDWIQIGERGGCVIYGRSDSTVNRQGVRIGTSEIYRVVESLPEVVDSLAIDLEALGRDSHLALFVVLREGATLDDGLRERVRQALRRDISPRHLPDEIVQVAEVPYTLSGKKMEVPVRRILLGQPVAAVVSPGSMRNPAALDVFVAMAERIRPAP